MSYTPVDIPFVTGQDGSYDRKILPVGPLHRVENAYQERTGRMVEKPGLESRPDTTLGGEFIAPYNYKDSLPHDQVITDSQGLIQTVKYEKEGDTALVLSGTHVGAFGYVDSLRGIPAEGMTDTFSPCTGVTDTAIIFCYCSGKSTDVGQYLHIDVYDRETLQLLRRQTREVGNIREVKISSNPSREDWVLAVRATTILFLKHLPTATSTYSGNSDHLFPTVAPEASFQLSDCANNSLAFWVIWVGSSFNLTATGFDRSPGVPQFDSIALSVSTAPDLAFHTRLPAIAAWDRSTFYAALSFKAPGDNWRVDVHTIENGVSTSLNFIVGNEPCSAAGLGIRLRTQASVAASFGDAFSDRNANLNGSLAGARRGRRAFPLSPPLFRGGAGLPNDRGVFVVGEFPRQADGGSIASDDDAIRSIAGSIALITPGTETGGDVSEAEASGILLKAGGSDLRRVYVGSWQAEVNNVDAIFNPWTPPPITEWSTSRDGHVNVSIEERIPLGIESANTLPSGVIKRWRTTAIVRVLNSRTSKNNIFSETWGDDSAVVAGAGVGVMTSPVSHFGGFTGAPYVSGAVIGGGGGIDGTFLYQMVVEYTDPKGRIWRSIPSNTFEQEVTGAEVSQIDMAPCLGAPIGSVLVVYRTVAGGATFYRLTVKAFSDTSFLDLLPDSELTKEPLVIYTLGGVQSNDPPPLGRYIARTRDRFWVGRGEIPTSLQVSKFLRTTEGLHWSNLDNFSLDMPEAITGLAAMDETLVVFSAESIFLVHPSGAPDDQGRGELAPPQHIPSSTGCSSANGIVVADAGVYFVSKRGIELINRGFSAPQFVGDPVRDITDEYPVCLSSVILQDPDQIRWVMARERVDNSIIPGTVVLVLDTRVRAWSVYRYPTNYEGIGRFDNRKNPGLDRDGATYYNGQLDNARRETHKRTGSIVPFWETGELRPAGMNGGAYGRRVNILGTYQADCDITLTMAFNDAKEFSARWTKTWELRAADYAQGDPVVLELTLPVQKFWSVKFKLTAARIQDGDEGFQANGLTVFFDTEGGGPRVGSGSKG